MSDESAAKLKKITPPAPLVFKDDKGNEIGAKPMCSFVLNEVMKQEFWRDHPRAALEIIDTVEANLNGPWTLQQKAHQLLQQGMMMRQPQGQLVFSDPRENRFFLACKLSVDDADLV